MLAETGADGLAIGRGAVGNPFIFSEIKAALEGREYTPPSYEEILSSSLSQLRCAIEDKGERVAVLEARKQIALYFKGFRSASYVRKEINGAESYAEVEKILLSTVEKKENK